MSEIALTLSPVPWLLVLAVALGAIFAYQGWYARRDARIHASLDRNAARLAEWKRSMDEAGVVFDGAWRAKDPA